MVRFQAAVCDRRLALAACQGFTQPTSMLMDCLATSEARTLLRNTIIDAMSSDFCHRLSGNAFCHADTGT